MRDKFRAYYPPSEAEYEVLWREGFFVLDASALLNLYRYSSAARNELLDILEAVKDRIWLPHQAGLEYQRNRLNVMAEQRGVYSDLREALKKGQQGLEKSVEPLSRHPVIEVRELRQLISDAFRPIYQYVQEQEAKHPDLPGGSAPGVVDEVRARLTQLFEGRVGPAYTGEELERLYELAATRYEKRVPPGYADRDKEEEFRYGDFLLWRQILDHANEANAPIVLVTDDRKEDWWWRFNGQIIGPRPELVSEAISDAGVLFHMYRPDQFMRWAQGYLERSVNEKLLVEVREVGKTSASQMLHRYEEELSRRLAVRERMLDRHASKVAELRHAISKLRQQATRQPGTVEQSLEAALKDALHRKRAIDLEMGDLEHQIVVLKRAQVNPDLSVSDANSVARRLADAEKTLREVRESAVDLETKIDTLEQNLGSPEQIIGFPSTLTVDIRRMERRLQDEEMRLARTEESQTRTAEELRRVREVLDADMEGE